jgi:hypothetical protein
VGCVRLRASVAVSGQMRKQVRDTTEFSA